MTQTYPPEHYPPPGSSYSMADLKAHEVTFTGYGDAAIIAYVARPAQDGRYPGILIVHGTNGYEEHMRDVARRLAVFGYGVIVPALYSREAFLGVLEDGDFQTARKWQSGRPNAQTIGDLQAAFTFLKQQDYIQSDRIGLIGFCSGAHVALLFACSTKGLSCFVDCYSSSLTRTTESSPVAVVQRVKDLCCPILGLFGRDDTNPSPDQVEALRRELVLHHKEFEIVSYKNAGHAFLSDTRDTYRPEAAAAAWGRIIEWFSNHLKP